LFRQRGFTAEVVNRWLPEVNRRRDLFHCADVLVVHARDRRFLLVQCTSLANVSARVTKSRRQPELRDWLKAGGEFEVWGWSKRAGEWVVKRVAIGTGSLEPFDLQAPPRRRREAQQGLLFDVQGDG